MTTAYTTNMYEYLLVLFFLLQWHFFPTPSFKLVDVVLHQCPLYIFYSLFITLISIATQSIHTVFLTTNFLKPFKLLHFWSFHQPSWKPWTHSGPRCNFCVSVLSHSEQNFNTLFQFVAHFVSYSQHSSHYIFQRYLSHIVSILFSPHPSKTSIY